MHVHVDRGNHNDQALDTSLLLRFAQGHGRQVRVPVRVAAGLEPPPQLAVEHQERPLPCRIDHECRTGEVTFEVGSLGRIVVDVHEGGDVVAMGLGLVGRTIAAAAARWPAQHRDRWREPGGGRRPRSVRTPSWTLPSGDLGRCRPERAHQGFERCGSPGTLKRHGESTGDGDADARADDRGFGRRRPIIDDGDAALRRDQVGAIEEAIDGQRLAGLGRTVGHVDQAASSRPSSPASPRCRRAGSRARMSTAPASPCVRSRRWRTSASRR